MKTTLKLTLVLVALSVLSPTWAWGKELERSSGQDKEQAYGRGIGYQEYQDYNKEQDFGRGQGRGKGVGRGNRRDFNVSEGE